MKKNNKCDGPTDQPTDRPTNQLTNQPTNKATKNHFVFCHYSDKLNLQAGNNTTIIKDLTFLA